MPNYRFYDPQAYKLKQPHTLSPNAAHHVATVLRLKVGQRITLFDGQGQEALADIISLKRQNVSVMIESVDTISRESPLTLHLGQGVSKGDKMDMVVQKAVELGVTHFTPLITQHTPLKFDGPRREKKTQQWNKIAQSAAEQCGRNTLMHIHPLIHFNEYLSHIAGKSALMLDPRSTTKFNTLRPPEEELYILIGPEGGFSTEEQQQAIQAGCVGISLGKRILRTETAALAVCTLVQSYWGDL